jgi:hypothetical protein
MIVVLTRSQIDEGLNPAPIILWDLGQAAQHSEPISSTVGWGEYHHLLSRDVVRWQNINSDARKHKTMIRCGKLLFFTHSRGIFFFSIYNCSLQKSFAFLPWIDWYLLFICRAQKWKQIKDIILSSSSVQREKTDAHEVVPWKSLWWLNIEW